MKKAEQDIEKVHAADIQQLENEKATLEQQLVEQLKLEVKHKDEIIKIERKRLRQSAKWLRHNAKQLS